MLIHETSKRTNLTKKAIEYYIEHKLVCPNILENGYRDFDENDIDRLKHIFILRKLGLGIEEIRMALADNTGSTLQRLSIKKQITIEKEQKQKALLEKLSSHSSYDEIYADLNAIQQSETIAEKLLHAFPGYYGGFICLHFASYLNEPITTEVQQEAYEEIINFLDNTPQLYFPEDLQVFLMENTKHFSTKNITMMLEHLKQSIEEPNKFLTENKEFIKDYLAFKQSEEYKNSPLCKIGNLLKQFNSTSGYYDIFIPAMKKLSISYANYYKQVETANEKLLAQYPQITKWEE